MTALELIVVALVACYLVSALDDLVFDLTYWWRWLRGRARRPPLRVEALDRVPHRKAAIVTATWREENVVGRMVLYNAAAIEYDNYDVIVGTYPNDPHTQAEVDRAAGLLPNVIKVVTPHPGPTSKADCLNSVVAEIMKREELSGEMYDFVLMHDPEDVIHPLELKLVNYWFERYDVHMLQLPVHSVRVPYHQLTGGTYMDEFAEFYTKDMMVREWLTGFVPSAGVATAIRRDVLDCLAEDTNGRPFAINSLTEDYDVGLELAVSDYRTHVLAERVRWRKRGREVDDLVATRAPFPTTFATSVRQRTRWTIGIVYQAWQHWGWPGSRAIRWVLAHDRKAPLAYATVAAGYLVVLYVLGYGAVRRFLDPTLHPLLADDRLSVVFAIGLVLMVNRLLQRAIATTRIYGPLHGLLSIVRQPWGNVIYTVVNVRAAWTYFQARRRGQQVVWDKTRNVVPEYVANRVRLGEHLIDAGRISPQQLVKALRAQARSYRLLGEILVEQRAASVVDIERALDEIQAGRALADARVKV